MSPAARAVVSETNVPRPTCASSSPRLRASPYARVTVVRSISRALDDARCVGIFGPRRSLPLAMSAAKASTMRMKTGPCHSDNVGSQSMQFSYLSLIVWLLLLIAWFSLRSRSFVMTSTQQLSTAEALWRGVFVGGSACWHGAIVDGVLLTVHTSSVSPV